KALKKDKEERYQVVKDLGLDLKSLKQRLEFEEERDRTETSERTSQTRGAATMSEGSAGTDGTSKIAARLTAPAAGGDMQTTSSAATSCRSASSWSTPRIRRRCGASSTHERRHTYRRCRRKLGTRFRRSCGCG